MSQPLSKSNFEYTDREPSKKKPTSRDYQNDFSLDDGERISSNLSKGGSAFDFSNFGIFFKHKPTNSRGSNDSYASRLHQKKKSYETTSSKESTLKNMSSKDFSNIEELFNNTTVIANGSEPKQHAKKVSNEMSFSKTMNDDGYSAYFEDPIRSAYTDRLDMKGGTKGGNSLGIFKQQREERPEPDILGTLSKLDLLNESEEQKAHSVSKDFKLPKGFHNLEVIERIKNKSLPRRTSASNNSQTSGLNTSGRSNANTPQNAQTVHYGLPEVRNNNNSVFNGSKKYQKGTNQYQNQNPRGDVPFSNNFSADPARQTSSAITFSPFDPNRAFPISELVPQTQGSDGFMMQGANNFSNKSLEFQKTRRDLEGTNEKKRPTLSTLTTDTTIDDDHHPTSYFNFHNNNFSPFSGTNSYNNSGKVDFNSPIRADSGKYAEHLHASGNQPHRGLMSAQAYPVSSFQNNNFNMGQNLMNLYGGHASGNNTDRSSFSWNDEITNSSVLSTPQGRQHQSFFNTSLNLPSTSSREQQYTSVPQASNKNPYLISRNKTDNTLLQSCQSLTQSFNLSTPNSGNSSKTNKKQSSARKEMNSNTKSKKKHQDSKDSSLFDVDPKNIERFSHTTLMVRNIPNKYDLPLFLEAIEKNNKGRFDFLYLPIDPRNKCNVGYAFINFVDCRYITNFYNEFNNKKWERFNSEKICEIKYARIQGKQALIHHFQYSNVMNQHDKNLKPFIPHESELVKPHQIIRDLVTKQRKETFDESYEGN